MTKQQALETLERLGNIYTEGHCLWPYVEHATKKSLLTRCAWLQRAIEIKPTDPDNARILYRAAWETYYLSDDQIKKTGASYNDIYNP